MGAFLFVSVLLIVGMLSAAVWYGASMLTGYVHRAAMKHATDMDGWLWWEISSASKEIPESRFEEAETFVTFRLWDGRSHRLFVAASPERQAFGKWFAEQYGATATLLDRPPVLPNGPLSAWRQPPPLSVVRRSLETPGISPHGFSMEMEHRETPAAIVVLHRRVNPGLISAVKANVLWQHARGAGGSQTLAASATVQMASAYDNGMHVTVYGIGVTDAVALKVIPVMSNTSSRRQRMKDVPDGWARQVSRWVLPSVPLSRFDPYYRASKALGPSVVAMTDTNLTGADSPRGRGLQWAPNPFRPLGDYAPPKFIGLACSPPSISDAASVSGAISGGVPAFASGDTTVQIGMSSDGRTPVGIPRESIASGVLTTGSSRTGKSVMLTNIARQLAEHDRNTQTETTHLVLTTKAGSADEVARWITPSGFRTSTDWADRDDPSVALRFSATRSEGIPFSLIEPSLSAAENAARITAALSYSAGDGMQDRAESLARAVFTLALLMPESRRQIAAATLGYDVGIAEMVGVMLNQRPDVPARQNLTEKLDYESESSPDEPVDDLRAWNDSLGTLSQWYPDMTNADSRQRPDVQALNAVLNKFEVLLRIPGWWETADTPTLADIVSSGSLCIVDVPGPSDGGTAAAASAIFAHLFATTILTQSRSAGHAATHLYHDELSHLAGASMGVPEPIMALLDTGQSAGASLFLGFQRLDQVHFLVLPALLSMKTFVAFMQLDGPTAENAAVRLNSGQAVPVIGAADIQRLQTPGGALVSTRTGMETAAPFPARTTPPPSEPKAITEAPSAPRDVAGAVTPAAVPRWDK